MNRFKVTLVYFVICGLWFGISIGILSLKMSNLFIAGHTAIAWIIFMMGLPTEKRKKWLNYFFWFLVVSIIPAWGVYLVV